MKPALATAHTLTGALAVAALVSLAPVASSGELACRISGLERYEIRATHPGSGCVVSAYIQACSEAEQIHREKCQEF
ncbi:MAG: hypothetical protein JRH16_17825 [Deltaproteobacteria bacterium]|nr:hypothetical protein [Deltaproteobacteria bacterium]MBW2361051.1 hypothetical protein [Deltaproteobacteria bacterium]